MTFRSLITGTSIGIDFPKTIVGFPAVDGPKRYNVLVCKGDKVFLGHVVSFLDIEDWCVMKGYDLKDVDPGTRFAYEHERTQLF